MLIYFTTRATKNRKRPPLLFKFSRIGLKHNFINTSKKRWGLHTTDSYKVSKDYILNHFAIKITFRPLQSKLPSNYSIFFSASVQGILRSLLRHYGNTWLAILKKLQLNGIRHCHKVGYTWNRSGIYHF